MLLKPGSMIGIIGGGQLARMLAMAAARLGLRVAVLEPDKNCPAAQVANIHLLYNYDDEAGLAALADIADVITYEFENVPVGAAQYLERNSTLYPPSRALEISQDRLVEKDFLNGLGIATAGYFDIENLQDLNSALKKLGGVGILKTRRLGYDGKGQIRFDDKNPETVPETVEEKYRSFGMAPAIIEGMVAFEREISVIASRDVDGNFSAFDPAWNTHRDGILRQSVVPSGVGQNVEAEAFRIAQKIMDELSYVGVMGTEFFVTTENQLLVNEIAPRVHNSGHWTEAACCVSQFEQHIRAIVNWPLLDNARHSNCVMENIIGHEVDDVEMMHFNDMQMLHLYGKSDVRSGRKMGHLTRLSPKH